MVKDITPELIPHLRKTCECTFCGEFDKRNEILKSGSKAELRQQVEYFSEKFWDVEADLSYFMCVKDGSWNTAVETLEIWLDKARNVRNAALSVSRDPAIPEHNQNS